MWCDTSESRRLQSTSVTETTAAVKGFSGDVPILVCWSAPLAASPLVPTNHGEANPASESAY